MKAPKRSLTAGTHEETPGGNRGLESQEKQATMTTEQFTPTPALADMARTRCPEWCAARSSATVHAIDHLDDSTHVVRHTGRLVISDGQQYLTLERTVRWTSEGDLIASQEAIELDSIRVETLPDALELADAIRQWASSLPVDAHRASERPVEPSGVRS